jgi:signal peptidase I
MAKFVKKNNSSGGDSLDLKVTSIPFLKNFFSFYSFLKKRFSFLRWLDPFTYVDLFFMPHVKRVTKNEYVETFVNIVFALLFAWIVYSLLGFLFQTSMPLVIVYSASMEPSFFRGDVMALFKPSQNDFFGQVVFLDENISNVPVNKFVSSEYDSENRLVSFSVGGQKIAYEKNASVIVYPAYNPTSLNDGKPIIHRTIVKLVAKDGNFVLTKGDNDREKIFVKELNASAYSNPFFDQDCGDISFGLEKPSKPCISLYAVPFSSIQGRSFFRIPLVGCFKLWLVDDLFSLALTGKLPSDFKGIC